MYGYIRMFIDQRFGILTFAPFLIFSIVAMFRYVANKRILPISLASILFFGLVVGNQWLGTGYYHSNRFIVPVIPLLAIPTCMWYQSSRQKLLDIAFKVLVVISFLINLQAVLRFEGAAKKPPWYLIQLIINLMVNM